MTGPLLSSKIIIEEEAPRVRGIPSAPTAVLGAVGVTERGPVGQATRVTSFEAFQTIFGSFTPSSDLALAVMGYFENGGRALWVVRTVHYSDVHDSATATAVRSVGLLQASGVSMPATLTGNQSGPFALANGATIILSVAGGADETAIFQGTAAELQGTASGPWTLTDGQTLLLRLDDGVIQTITFSQADFSDITQATLQEVVAAINAALSGGKATVRNGGLLVASDTEGTASAIEVTGGSASAVLGLPAGRVAGTGHVADLRRVTLAEVQAVVDAHISDVTVSATEEGTLRIQTTAMGSFATLQARAGTHAAFGLDALLHTGSDAGRAPAVRLEGKDPGAYANRIAVEVRRATSGEAGTFDVWVREAGVYRETFPNLSLDPNQSRHIASVMNDPRNGSVFIRAQDIPLPQGASLDVQTVALTGGDDGLSGLHDSDFIGSPTAKTGLSALDPALDLTLLTVPGRATPAVHNAMLRYCEVVRKGSLFAVLDPPAGLGAAAMVTYVQTTAGLLNLSEYAALYWPRVKILNPSRRVFGPTDQVVVPPSGIICGVYARTDGARPGGVYDPPAGTDKGRMLGVLGFETNEVLEEANRNLVYPKRINPLTTAPGLPRFIDGSRTLKGDGHFPFVAERRGVIFIERSLKDGLHFARHKNNTEGLRAQVRRGVYAFLLTQMNNRAFRSQDPAKAFFVDVSDELNPPSVIFSGKLIARVGLATNKPAEFIILKISQDTRALEAELASANS